jgi:hypothetical protein
MPLPLFGKKEIVDSTGNLVEKIGDAFDKNFTSKEERDKARNELMTGLFLLITDMTKMSQEVALAEAGGNWLQRSWRPLMMLAFGFIIVTTWFVFPLMNIFIKSAELSIFIMQLKEATQFWDVVQLGLGGYMIGRSAEKIVDSMGKNMNISIGKK